jgi:hypothetical protein
LPSSGIELPLLICPSRTKDITFAALSRHNKAITYWSALGLPVQELFTVYSLIPNFIWIHQWFYGGDIFVSTDTTSG